MKKKNPKIKETTENKIETLRAIYLNPATEAKIEKSKPATKKKTDYL